MPVRSLDSSVLRWPNRAEVREAVTAWGKSLGHSDPNVVNVGFRGSYADGTWGVGSDIDLIVVVESSDRDFIERGRSVDATVLPVPADVLVYTVDEASRLKQSLGLVEWVYLRSQKPAKS